MSRTIHSTTPWREARISCFSSATAILSQESALRKRNQSLLQFPHKPRKDTIMPPSTSKSRGKAPQSPPSSPGATSSSTNGSMESTPSDLGIQSQSEQPAVLRRSLRIAAAVQANAHESPLPGAMHGIDSSSSPSSLASPSSDESFEVGFHATSDSPNDCMSIGGAGGKRKAKSGNGGSGNKRRRRGRPLKAIRIGGNDGDESESEQEGEGEASGRGGEKRKGKEIVDEGSVKAKRKLTYKDKGKGKLIGDGDSEPVKISDEDREKLREMVQKAVSQFEELYFEPPPQPELPEGEEGEGEGEEEEEEVLVDQVVNTHQALDHLLMEKRERLKESASHYAYFKTGNKKEPMEDGELMLDKPWPFSKALMKVKERETVKPTKRIYEADDSQAGFSAGNNTDEVETLWTPSTNAKEESSVRKATSLQELTAAAFLKTADVIETFKGIPFAIRNQLCIMLSKIRKMNMRHLVKMMEGNLVDLRLIDCSWASEKNFKDAFGQRDMSKLKVLQLDLCGGCMPDSVLCATLAFESNSLPSLTKLSLKGAYGISDQGLSALVSSAPQLSSINLCQCTLLTTEGIINLIDKLALVLKKLYIDDCNNINAMSILPSLKKVKRLEVLSMAGISSVSNKFVHELMPVCGSTIKELNFADCSELTSSAIKVIGENCPHLSVLDIRNLTELNDSSVAYLANGCRVIQVLRLCRNSFSDEAIAAFIEASETSGSKLVELSLNNVTKVGRQTAISISERCRILKKLDLSFCYNMSNQALGLIVDSCSSLRTLKLFGCTQVTNEFLHNYSNPCVNILGVGANLTENIEIPEFM